MYDTKSDPNEFVGDTREEAITKATRFYGVEESELTVKEPAPGEIFGLGARSVVVAYPKGMKAKPRSSGGDRGDRGGRDRGDRGRGRERGRGRGGDREGGGRDGGRRPERSSREAVARSADVGQQDSRPAAPSKPSGPSQGTAMGELGKAGQYLLGMVERMALGLFEVKETEEGGFVMLALSGEAADALSAGDSRAIGALQLLVNQAAMQRSETPKRIVLDCGGDVGERESFLERQAGRAAKRALDTGRAVALDPMNGRDRRALHMAVRPIENVVTMSVGTGAYRQVVIVPAGADEYDEALKASEEALARGRDRE